MAEVRIRPGEPDEITIPTTVGWEREEEIGKMWRLLIHVERSYLDGETVNRKEDAVELAGDRTGILVDVETGGPTWTLVVYSYEWAANRTAPTVGGNRRSGDDQALITDLINDVPEWTAGSVGNFTGPMTFVFNHAHRHEALRRIEKNVPGELRFRDQGTVDYVDRRGSDRSASVELSGSAGTLEDEITIVERGRELDGTHIRVLGAHEGEAQYYANLVPQADPQSYPNDVRYSTPRWTSADDTDWDRWENMDVVGQDTIEEEAAALGEELSDSLVEAEATVSGVDLNVGDTVQVVKPDANLDRPMRIHRLKEVVSDGAKRVYECLLSTRTTLRADDGDDLRDIQRFNTAFQGSSVVIQGGGSRQPVDATHNAEIPFDYPAIEYENEASLHVRGLPYRHYSIPNQHDHDVIIDTTTAESSSMETTNALVSGFAGAGSASASETVSSTANNQRLFAMIHVVLDTSHTVTRLRLEDTTVGEVLWDINVAGSNDEIFTNLPIDSEYTDRTGNNIQVTAYFSGSADGGLDIATYAESDHSHAISDTETSETAAGVTPGIEETADTPSGVDVIVGGSTVASDIGSGTFKTTVDISGELTVDAWNLIELSSDSLGHIQATVSVDGYKQIGSDQ